MTKKWSWLNADKTEIVRTITNGDGNMSLVDGRKSGYHADDYLLSSGALPHIEPSKTRFQDLTTPFYDVDHISYVVNDKPEQAVIDILTKEIKKVNGLKSYLLGDDYKREKWQIKNAVLMFKTQTWLAGQGSSLTGAEQTEQLFIQGLMGRYASLADAEADIIQEILAMPHEERLLLANDWASTNPTWTE